MAIQPVHGVETLAIDALGPPFVPDNCVGAALQHVGVVTDVVKHLRQWIMMRFRAAQWYALGLPGYTLCRAS